MISKRIELLRLDYLFAVLVPAIIAIYYNELNLLANLGILIAFSFFGISGNIINDVFDRNNPKDMEAQERTEGYKLKELIAIAVASAVFGGSLLVRPIQDSILVLYFALIAIVLVLIYCWQKQIPIFNQILLAVSHIIMPYLIIKAYNGLISPLLTNSEFIMLMALVIFAVSGQSVHEIIDEDAISIFTLRTQQLVVIISAILSILIGAIAIVLMQRYILFGLLIIPLFIIYSFRKPKKSRKSIKDTGILMGNLVLVYFLTLTVIQG